MFSGAQARLFEQSDKRDPHSYATVAPAMDLLDELARFQWVPPHLIQAVVEEHVEEHVEEIDALQPLDMRLMERMPPIDAREFALPFRITQGPVENAEPYVDAPEDTRHWDDYEGLDYVGLRDHYERSLEPEEDLEDEMTVEADAIMSVEADAIVSVEADAIMSVEADAIMSVEADAIMSVEADAIISVEADAIISVEADAIISVEADAIISVEADAIISVEADAMIVDNKAPLSLAATKRPDPMNADDNILLQGMNPGAPHIATIGVQDVNSTSLAFGPILEPWQRRQ